MTWTLDHTDKENVYWRRSDDGYVIGFNRPGVGEPSSTEDAPPDDIDKYAAPVIEAEAKALASTTKADFYAQFSDEELKKLLAEAKTNPDLEVKLFRLHGISSLAGNEVLTEQIAVEAKAVADSKLGIKL